MYELTFALQACTDCRRNLTTVTCVDGIDVIGEKDVAKLDVYTDLLGR